MRFKEFLLLERDEDIHKQPRWKPAKKKLPPHDAEKMAKMYDGKPKKIMLPVVVANNKIEKKEFTVDNVREILQALSGKTLIDLSKAPLNPDERASKPSYIIKPHHPGDDASIPHLVHKLPKKTERKSGYAPEDLRREAYV